MAKEDEPDPTPLVKRLVEKTREGKVPWEPTAQVDSFVATVGGNTFKVAMVAPSWAQSEEDEYPALSMLNEKGQALWTVAEPSASLSALYRAAQRIANKVDERMANAIAALDKL